MLMFVEVFMGPSSKYLAPNLNLMSWTCKFLCMIMPYYVLVIISASYAHYLLTAFLGMHDLPVNEPY